MELEVGWKLKRGGKSIPIKGKAECLESDPKL
jgi:hypothetical protein